MATETREEPSYLGLLNDISLGESAAGIYLEAWANATQDEELERGLRFIAARESSHGEVFCRRIQELGFELRPKPDTETQKRIARFGNPKISDAEKLGAEEADFSSFFEDMERKAANGEFDPLTAKLMLWYIGEERDSGTVLKDTAARIRAEAKAKAMPMNGTSSNGSGPTADAVAIMDCMTQGFSRLEQVLEKLAMPEPVAAGRRSRN
jgi:hypothetical protein